MHVIRVSSVIKVIYCMYSYIGAYFIIWWNIWNVLIFRIFKKNVFLVMWREKKCVIMNFIKLINFQAWTVTISWICFEQMRNFSTAAVFKWVLHWECDCASSSMLRLAACRQLFNVAVSRDFSFMSRTDHGSETVSKYFLKS